MPSKISGCARAASYAANTSSRRVDPLASLGNTRSDGMPGRAYADSPPRQLPYVNQSIRVAKAGASFGSALAIAISWSEHHSILWAIIQGFFSWFYVVYYALAH